MQRNNIQILMLCILFLLHLLAEGALARETSLSAPINTLGQGLEYQQQIANILSLRKGRVHFSYSDGLPENIFFARQEKNLHHSAIADYRPWTGGFRLSAGFFYNDQLYGDKQNTTSVGNTLPVSTSLEQHFMAPYVGMGWGAAPNSKKNWIFTLDVGLLYQRQDTDASRQCLQHSCLGQNTAGLQPDTESLLYSIERYGLYPVLSAGITFKF